MSSQSLSLLPEPWRHARLDEVCLVLQGQSPPGSTYNTSRAGMPFLQGSAEFGDIHPTPSKWCSAPSKIAEAGDVLVSIRAPVGPTNMAQERCCIGRGLAALRPLGEVPSKYILYAVRATQEPLQAKTTGTTFAAIRGDDLRGHRIPLAPLAEQHRIVAAIEQQLTRLDAAVACLKRARTNLKRYRTSVLKAACEGRLVPTEADLARAEGRDYEHASLLLERILAERRAQWGEAQQAKRRGKGQPALPGMSLGKYKEPLVPETAELAELPEGWAWTTLGQLLLSGLQNGLYKHKSSYGKGVPILRIEDYQDDRLNSRDELSLLDVTAEEQRTYGLMPNDLVINRVNSPSHLGKCIGVPEALLPAVFESNMMRATINPGTTIDWIVTYLRSRDGRSRLTEHAKWAVNQASINQTDVTTTKVPLPPSAEQDRIVAEVERKLLSIQVAEQAIEVNLRRASRLRQAILKRAFEGRLVPQDPDDEPASVLLDRIKAQRESRDAAKPKRAPGTRGRRRKQPADHAAVSESGARSVEVEKVLP